MEYREKSESREMQRAKEGGGWLSLKNATVGLGLEKKNLIYTCFF